MRRIAILTAGGDTPALNATIFGAVERANALRVEVVGIIDGFSGLLDASVPYIRLNPLFMSLPELDPCRGGTLLGASRTYINADEPELMNVVADRLKWIGVEGLICIGGDGTINGMQVLTEHLPCVLAPKTIDNDLGLNYLDEPNEWTREASASGGEATFQKLPGRDRIELEDIINYATPGYATAVFVAAQGIRRIRTTAESHRRIAIIEVMGRQSGYIALGSSYGQPDIVLIPENPIDLEHLDQRIRELYDRQKHVVIVVAEGAVDQSGHQLGVVSKGFDPAGNVIFNGAAEALENTLLNTLGNDFFTSRRRHDTAKAAIFTRKIGHTQRGGRPILFDRFHATQLGGKSVDLLLERQNNAIATLQWSHEKGFTLDSIMAHKLHDQWRGIHPRLVHRSLYDATHFQPSKLGVEYLMSIFTNAVGDDDLAVMRDEMFTPGNLSTPYQSVNVDIQKRIQILPQA